MLKLLRRFGPWVVCLVAAVAAPVGAQTARIAPLAYEPVALGWSADEVERATAGNLAAIVRRAERDGQLGCRLDCIRLERTFARLVVLARQQTERARHLPWTLTVVRSPAVEAMALPGGQVLVSETVVRQRGLSDEALAFVLAHEMAHSILEHERQALTFARTLLPRHVPRTVADMYTEIDYNFGLLKSLEPVLQQGEFEADELGLLLASAAGYAPRPQLAFAEQEVDRPEGRAPLVRTHPSAPERLARLRERLPLAERVHASAPLPSR